MSSGYVCVPPRNLIIFTTYLSSLSSSISPLTQHPFLLSLSILFSSHSASFSPLTQHPFLLSLSILFSSYSASFSPLTQHSFLLLLRILSPPTLHPVLLVTRQDKTRQDKVLL